MFKKINQILGKLLFTKISPVIKIGKTRTLQDSDFPELPAWLQPRQIGENFRNISTANVRSFLTGILLSNKPRMLLVLFLIAGIIATNLCFPEIMHRLISGMQGLINQQYSIMDGIYLTFGFAGLIFLNALILQHYFYNVVNMEVFVINGVNFKIFSKTLRLSREARNKTPVGDIVSHLGSDTNAVSEFPFILAEVIYGICISILVLIVAWHYIGWGAVSAFAVLLVLSPLCQIVAKKYIHHDETLKANRDHRVSLMSQFISGIKIVKFLAWEQFAEKDILAVRSKELADRKKLALTRACSLLLFLCANSFAVIAALATWILNGNTLDAATVFAVIALFDLWQHPFANLSNYIAGISESRVSAKRIIDFLNQPEFEGPLVDAVSAIPPGLCLSDYSVRFPGSDIDVIKNWNLSITPGQSVAIIGAVGSGKSSFLLSLLGELSSSSGSKEWVLDGDAQVPKMAWIPQTPFVLNSTIRQNILIGSRNATSTDVDKALQVTAMTEDVSRFPAGLDTEIGEQGLNLSGGQKQRLCLARAALTDASVILLDDPLSAVDKSTEEHLIQNLIFGRWADKTRIVVTHRLEHLDLFDQVVFVKNGSIVASGSSAELLKFSKEFKEFIEEHLATDSHRKLTKSESEAPVKMLESSSGQLTASEDREEGAVRANVYFAYLAAMCGKKGRKRLIGSILLFGTTATVGLLPLLQNYWLSLWTGTTINSPSALRHWLSSFLGSDLHNLSIFASVALAGAVAGFYRLWIWTNRSIEASRSFHDNALKKTLRTFQRFYDTNPVGRILNRFSFDIDTVEGQLAMAFEQMVYAIGNVVIASIAIFFISPWSIVALIPCSILFYRLQNSYRCAARDTKRLNAVTRSPRFAHFKETLEGLDSIRAFRLERDFFETYYEHLEKNQKLFYAMIVENRWFSTRLPIISALVTACSVSAIVLAAQKGLVDPATAGLLMVYNLFFVDYLNFGVRSFSEAEARMTSVERLIRYGQHPEEPSVVGASPKPVPSLQNWPSDGSINFVGVSARYAEELPDVLKNFNLKIPSGHKVGFIGRTGSGKSTCLQVLFRIIPLSAGKVMIGGVDISKVPLQTLRRSIAIIPQDPILFTGTVRSNLDRYCEHSDNEIWEALQRVNMAEIVKSLKNDLAFEVQENGTNFSQGQRQLLCLARAILSDTKVIAMDEATASVDVITDRLIQKTIREAFSDRTVIIIAHRLGTISDCDMIVELANGSIVSLQEKKENNSLIPYEIGQKILKSTVRDTALAVSQYHP